MLLHQPDDAVDLLRGVDGPRRIVRRTEKDGLGAGCDLGLDGLDRGQAEAVLDAERQGDDLEAGEGGIAVVVRVIGLGNDDLVADISDDGEDEVDGLGPAGRDQDLVRPEGDIVVREVAGDGLPQLKKALGRAIAQDGLAPIVEGLHHRSRGGDVGVADIDVENLDPLGFGLVGVGLQLPDRGRLDVESALGNLHGRILPE